MVRYGTIRYGTVRYGTTRNFGHPCISGVSVLVSLCRPPDYRCGEVTACGQATVCGDVDPGQVAQPSGAVRVEAGGPYVAYQLAVAVAGAAAVLLPCQSH